MKKLYAVNNVLFLIFMLISIPTIFMSEIGSNIRWSRNENHNEIISTTKVNELLKDNKRKSLISFQEMVLVDSTKMVFIIPINQNILKKSHTATYSSDFFEKMPINNVNAMLKEIPDNKISIPNSLCYGVHNNIILYIQDSNYEKILFEKRVSICSIQMLTLNNKRHLAIRYTDVDSNNDEEMDLHDIQKISIFDLEGNLIQKIEDNALSLEDILFAEKNNLYVKAEDKEISRLTYGNTMQIVKVDINTGKQVQLITAKSQDYIQKILDGKTQ